MQKAFLAFLLLLGTAAFGQTANPFSAHRPIYFTAGWGDLVETQDWTWLEQQSPILAETLKARQLFKLSFSFRYELFADVHSGLYLGYTQIAFWNLLAESSPFMENDYWPEIFWRFQTKDNFAGNVDTGFLDHVQIGLEHLSNGVGGPDSRGTNRLYTEVALGYGDLLRAELSARYWLYLEQFLPASFYKPETTDVAEFRSNMEFGLRFTTPGPGLFFLPRELTLKGSPGGGYHQFDWTKGYVNAQLTFGSLIGGIGLFSEAFYGTGESLLNYDNSGFSLRFGLRSL